MRNAGSLPDAQLLRERGARVPAAVRRHAPPRAPWLRPRPARRFLAPAGACQPGPSRFLTFSLAFRRRRSVVSQSHKRSIPRRKHHAGSTGRRRPELHRRDHRGHGHALRLPRRQLGHALLPPQGLHPGVHHRARRLRQAQGRVRRAQREVDRDQRGPARLPQGLGRRTSRRRRAPRPNYPLDRRPRQEGRRPLRHDPPERERHRHRALGVHHRPRQEDQARSSPTRRALGATSTSSSG